MYGLGSTTFGNSTCICVLVKVRLAGNNTLPNVGRLEIYYNDTWGTVCPRAFDDKDAQVACYMLGFRYILLHLLSQKFSNICQLTDAMMCNDALMCV